MKQEEKQLLLVDLSARLTYGVKCKVFDFVNPYILSGISQDSYEELYFTQLDFKESDGYVGVKFCKPYLFPLSSMTSKQKAELSMLVANEYDMLKSFLIEIEFYHKHYFDYRGLIQKGLAIDCTNLNIYQL